MPISAATVHTPTPTSLPRARKGKAPAANPPATAVEVDLEAPIDRAKRLYSKRPAEARRILEVLKTPEAYYLLGMMHAGGDGVPQDYRKAAEAFAHSHADNDFVQAFRERDQAPHTALSLLKKSGTPDALCEAGTMFRNGEGVHINYPQAISHFKAADTPVAKIHRAITHITTRDFRHARALLHEAAEAGEADALYNLGIMELDGAGKFANPALAARYFAEADTPDSLFALAVLTYRGVHVKPDASKALKMLREIDLSNATLMRAKMHAEGKGTARNPEKAIQILREANSVEANDILLRMFLDEDAQAKDLHAAVPLLEQRGTTQSHVILARIRALGATGPRDIAAVVKDLEAANMPELPKLLGIVDGEISHAPPSLSEDHDRFIARQNSNVLRRELVKLFLAIDTPQSKLFAAVMPIEKPVCSQFAAAADILYTRPRQAIPFLEKSSQPHAHYELGRIYAEGRDVPIDFALAAQAFEKAGADEHFVGAFRVRKAQPYPAAARFEQSGTPDAHFHLGMMYANGELPVDLKKSVAEFDASCTPAANTQMGILFMKLFDSDEDLELAKSLLQSSASQGDPVARYRLALMRLEGKGFPKNPELAARLLIDIDTPAARAALAVMRYQGIHFKRDQASAERLLEELQSDEAQSMLRIIRGSSGTVKLGFEFS